MVGSICHRILNLVNAFPVVGKKIGHCDIGSGLSVTYPSGFFDGATTSNIGGADFTLHISSSHYFHVKLGCSVRTNKSAELMALWSLLVFAVSIGLATLSVFGDSQVIKNWANSMAWLAVVDLEH